MGGFEGGDEGGFWDEDALALLVKQQKQRVIPKKEKFYILYSDASYSAKANKTLKFVPCICESFSVQASEATRESASSIYKAFELLDMATVDSDVMDFFSEYKVVLSEVNTALKTSREVAQDTAVFLLLTKEVCNLVMSTDELAKIASRIDGTVVDFLQEYQSDLG